MVQAQKPAVDASVARSRFRSWPERRSGAAVPGEAADDDEDDMAVLADGAGQRRVPARLRWALLSRSWVPTGSQPRRTGTDPVDRWSRER